VSTKVLHLFSNTRWTGPAEPAVNLASALQDAGWDLTFAVGRAPRGRRNGVLEHARERDLPIRYGLVLGKHRNPLHDVPDARRLRRWLSEEPYEIVHAHMRKAHLIAGRAVRRRGVRPLIVRSCYEGEGPSARWERPLLQVGTDGLLLVSEMARRRVVNELGFPSERAWVVDSAVDVERFDPGRGLGGRREALGIAPDAFVVGIVARIQWRRRYDVFLEAIDRARLALPKLRAIIVGRGTNMKPIAVDPIEAMGLGDVVLLPGHHTGDDFVRTIASMDVKVYLVPGTDGSCRAAREAMAMGVPVIAARRGMLPELVEHGERGLVIDDTPENLANAIVALARDPESRRRMGEAARRYAHARFSLARQASRVGDIYRELMESRQQ
jgi:glycosyltransferase involved in cell wall biosynthesis